MDFLKAADFDTVCLKSFLAICEVGSFNKAATTLGVSQSTVSMHVKKLEDSLGSLLFERVGKTCILTEAGELFRDYCGELFSLSRGIESSLAALENAVQQRRTFYIDPLYHFANSFPIYAAFSSKLNQSPEAGGSAYLDYLKVREICSDDKQTDIAIRDSDGFLLLQPEAAEDADLQVKLSLRWWIHSSKMKQQDLVLIHSWGEKFAYQQEALAQLQANNNQRTMIVHSPIASFVHQASAEKSGATQPDYLLLSASDAQPARGFEPMPNQSDMAFYANVFGGELAEALS